MCYNICMDEIFKCKSPSVSKLEKYGFKKEGEGYMFQTPIMQGEFELHIFVSASGRVTTKVFDSLSHDEYTLYLVKSAEGSFVGKVRQAVEDELKKVCDKCFYQDVFKSRQAKEIISHIAQKYNSHLEFLWEKLPNAAIARCARTKKWFMVIMTMSKRKLKLDSDDVIDVIDLRVDPKIQAELVNNKNIFEGYHMNKKHWLTICLDEGVSMDFIKSQIEYSYNNAR